MADELNKIEALSKKLDELLLMHNNVSAEIDNLRVEIIELKVSQKSNLPNPNTDIPEADSALSESIASAQLSESFDQNINENEKGEDVIDDLNDEINDTYDPIPQTIPKKKFDYEKLIGENLISKIGMLILIIGVAIGAKYSIENDLISPLGRIISGYVVGIVLLGLGMWLKKKYLNFSAVLVSGAMAIFYFITFFAFNFYLLIGQEIAFGLMVIFTIFTVIAALNYDKELIAHLGLVGAVSVPFLLSNDSGNALFLFTYIAIINVGIAFISLKKNWKLLFYSSFIITWLVYFTWFVTGYNESQHFILALSFLTIFFILFYVIFIAYKFLNLKKYNVGDVVILLLNSLFFFSIGYVLLAQHKVGGQLLGAFAITNGLIHFVAAFIINKRKLADRNLFYLIVGLVLICLTLAIPIQLDGHWVTIMWSLEAVVLFLIGRSKQVAFYEYMSLALIGVAGLSLMHDWGVGYITISSVELYQFDVEKKPLNFLFNTVFLTSLISCISLGLIFWAHNNSPWKEASKIRKSIIRILDYIIPIALILTIYFTFRWEIIHYFSQILAGSIIENNPHQDSYYLNIYNVDIKHRANIWLLNYTLLFASLVSIVIYKKAKDIKVSCALIAINLLIIGAFLIQGLYELSILREHFLNQYQAEYFNIDNSFIWLRYLSIACLALLIGCTVFLLKKVNKSYRTYAMAETVFYLVVLWVTTSELIQWLDITEKSETYGLALSIFWGIFSVIIIAFGIWKKKKHLRFLGIAIFAITLCKLFFYDLSNLTTIAKTTVMISLGALLLLTSFLYNKYTIEDEEKL